MTFYLICGIVGLVLLLFQMISGHDGDFHHDFDHGVDHGSDHSVSVFSFRTIVVFLTGFGLIGALCMYLGLNQWISGLIGTGSGFVLGLIAWSMMKFAMKQQASSLIDINEMVGREAIVHTSIPINGIGEVAIELNGQRKHQPARSQDATDVLRENSLVKIVKNMGGTLIVEPLK